MNAPDQSGIQMDYKKNKDYWANFYRQQKNSAPVFPSQFAAFTINELAPETSIIEFGCGNGRDSYFFASHGFPLLALDASEQAIALCRARNPFTHADYIAREASAARREVEHFLQGRHTIAVYARFFLHAIGEEEQGQFLELLNKTIPQKGKLFFEYRTIQDENNEKTFGKEHYRRYLDHEKTLAEIESNGFSIEYETEGRGMAKFKTEDARIGRCIAHRVD